MQENPKGPSEPHVILPILAVTCTTIASSFNEVLRHQLDTNTSSASGFKRILLHTVGWPGSAFSDSSHPPSGGGRGAPVSEDAT